MASLTAFFSPCSLKDQKDRGWIHWLLCSLSGYGWLLWALLKFHISLLHSTLAWILSCPQDMFHLVFSSSVRGTPFGSSFVIQSPVTEHTSLYVTLLMTSASWQMHQEGTTLQWICHWVGHFGSSLLLFSTNNSSKNIFIHIQMIRPHKRISLAFIYELESEERWFCPFYVHQIGLFSFC